MTLASFLSVRSILDYNKHVSFLVPTVYLKLMRKQHIPGRCCQYFDFLEAGYEHQGKPTESLISLLATEEIYKISIRGLCEDAQINRF